MICPKCIHSKECETYKKELEREKTDKTIVFFGCDGYEEPKKEKL